MIAAGGPKERGSATVELALIAPGFLLLLTLTILAGRVVLAGGSVEQAAGAAARAASLARNPATAQTDAVTTAQDMLAGQHLRCATTTVTVDTSGFAVPLGRPAQVTATVTCEVALSDLALPGFPGSRRLVASARSPLDAFRGRSG